MVRKSRSAVAAGLVFACLLGGASQAQALTGALSSPACIGGDTATAPGCSQVTDSAVAGTDSGLDELQSVDISPDGQSIYATSQGDDAIVHLERNATTGAVTFSDCISGETGSGPSGSTACAGLAASTATGAGSSLNEPSDAVISSNGNWLYMTAQGDDAIVRFSRTPERARSRTSTASRETAA